MVINKKNRGRKTGFTLVELLAVIVILAIILVIAVPKIMSVIEDAKKATLESTAKMIASQAEKQKVQNQVLGNDKEITCKDITNINDVDYASCKITFIDNAAQVTITGSGKFEGLNICNGTKTSAEATNERCVAPVLNCSYDGELEQGTEFIHNQYTYRYKQEYHYYGNEKGWVNIDSDGWGVILTDKASTAPVNTPLCTYINNKPLISTTSMFAERDSNNKKVQSQTDSIDVSLWNTSTVTNMTEMFLYVGYKNENISITGLETLDTSNVTDMSYMFTSFGEESTIANLNISGWDTSNVTDMSYMFYSFGTKSTIANLNISGWDTSNVTDMSYMFYSFGYSSEDINLIGIEMLDTSNVTNMFSMFEYFGGICETINMDLSNWDTSNVTDMSYMFYDFGERVTNITLNISNWDTSNVTDMSGMFQLFAYWTTNVTLNISNWDTSNVTDMSYMFSDSFDTVTTVNIIGLETLDTSSVMYMTGMFNYAFTNSWGKTNQLIKLNLSNWDTSNVTDMSYMFWGFGFDVKTVTLNISNWDTSNVTDMSEMFYGLGRNATTITLNLNNWNTSNVTNMKDMFEDFGEDAEIINLTLGNKFMFKSEHNMPSYSWIKTYDVNNNVLSDTTQYTTNQLIKFTDSTTPTIGGTWSKVS